MALPDSIITDAAWAHCERVLRPVLVLASANFIDGVAARLTEHSVQDAVAAHDSARLAEWMLGLADRQGISNHAAIAFAKRQGATDFMALTAALAERPCCLLLRSRWHFDFERCGYRKTEPTCARPFELPACPLPRVGARKGTLSAAAVGLALFIRDVCDGDLVAWIDHRLAGADRGAGCAGRPAAMRAALLEPLTTLPGFGPKVASMILAELLIAGDRDRERWITTGASFIAIDSLVHAWLRRTGILRRLEAEHPYGPACHSPSGCADVVAGLAERVDARDFNKGYPQTFDRWIQFSIWQFCAAGGYGICNSNRIDDRARCDQRFCPSFTHCDRCEM